MRRDYFTIHVNDVGWVDTDGTPAKPRLDITYEGPKDTLRSVFFENGTTSTGGENVDVGFRLRASIDNPDATGVLAITDRLTGDFLMEMNTDVEPMLDFIRAARRYGEAVSDPSGRYLIEIELDENHTITLDKRTFLVYNQDGSLLRQHSLIPSGVEL